MAQKMKKFAILNTSKIDNNLLEIEEVLETLYSLAATG